MVAALAAIITGFITLVVTTLLLAGGRAIVTLVACAGGFDRIIIVLVAGSHCRCTSVIGHLACKGVRRHENSQRTERSR
ncbi:hypothetical protein EB233_17815 [Mesorhizobium erdmanii]|uniref:Uncharacterized protein n=1 Tax=Mesorhizobium erdmanii TaxID=1777866 RepID=A0A6M7UJY3_9HYPH|nr:hypothetical protein EB233_17815 [Mesorhizobium erdmanii]